VYTAIPVVYEVNGANNLHVAELWEKLMNVTVLLLYYLAVSIWYTGRCNE
jgi:hypothetical protein